MSTPSLTLHHIFQAKKTIAPVARATPLILSDLLTERVGANVYLKLEILPETGAFKVRGAANKTLNLFILEGCADYRRRKLEVDKSSPSPFSCHC